MTKQSPLDGLDSLILNRVILSVWNEAEAASQARHAARAVANSVGAELFGQLKIKAIQRAMLLAPSFFHVCVHDVEQRSHYSILCKLNRRRLHVPMWVQLPRTELAA